ncbi:MAG: MaoC family protein, partial [Acidimicrobiales bacterium]
MPINPDAVGSKSEPHESSWDSKDCLLYALGVGAGCDELAFTTENTKDVTQKVLPTFAVIAGMGGNGAIAKIGSFNPAMLVHGEQSITLHGEIPAKGTVRATSEVVGIYDKTKAAVVAVESG